MKNKAFNVVLPIEIHKKLKMTSFEAGLPMSKLIRRGIDYVLGKYEGLKNEN